MSYKILAINPGSTSTKIAVYEDEKEILSETLSHPKEELDKYSSVMDQFEMRKEHIINFLRGKGVNLKELSAVVGRGGHLPPVKSGAYKVNQLMSDRLRDKNTMEHASNLGALISFEIATLLGIPSYIYDPVAVDEMSEIARISGHPEIKRLSYNHYLNTRAMAMKAAKKRNKKYDEMNIIAAHLGGGISVNIHAKGRIVDVIGDEEGPFSPERTGGLPATSLVNLCYSGKYGKDEMKRSLRGNGGLKAYLGTVDVREVERRIAGGDAYAKLIYEAMAYQVAKCIGSLAPVVEGKVDLIILTGGIAHSKAFTSMIEKRVSFLAPVEIMAGENEMEALALGALRVLKGEEEAKEYVE